MAQIQVPHQSGWGRFVGWVASSLSNLNRTNQPGQGLPTVGIALLGETGAGKSTFYQALLDHVMGKTVEEVIAANGTERNEDMKEGGSQTKCTVTKDVKGPDYVLHIIDTPGIGDTEGVDEDAKHVDNITEFMSRHEFNAICIVVKNGSNRSTQRMGYIINEIKSNMTTDIWPDQVFTILTRCAVNRDPGLDTLAVIEEYGLPTDDEDGERFFTVDNYAYERTGSSKVTKAKRIAYEEAQGQLAAIINAARRQPLKSGSKIGELRVHRLSCRDKAKEMDSTIKNIEATETTLAAKRAQLKAAQTDQAAFSDFETEEYVEKKVPRDMAPGTKATVCGICDTRCHDPCHLANYGRILGCAAFHSDGSCSCGHSVSNHRHTNKYWVTERVLEPVLNPEYKRRYEQARTNEEKIAAATEGIMEKLETLKRKKDEFTRAIAKIYVEIDTLAAESFNEFFPKYIEEQQVALENMRLGRAEKERRRAEYRKQIELYDRIKAAALSRR